MWKLKKNVKGKILDEYWGILLYIELDKMYLKYMCKL